MKLRTVYYQIMNTWLRLTCRSINYDAFNTVSIIMVHGVYDEVDRKLSFPFPSMLSLNSLKSNVQALMKTHSFISMGEATRMLSGETNFRQRSVVLTFDDSLKCYSDIVAPMLSNLGVPAIFYVSTDAIENQEIYWWLRLDYTLFYSTSDNVIFEFPNGDRYNLKDFQTQDGLKTLKKKLKNCSKKEQDSILAEIETKSGVYLDKNLPEYRFAAIMAWDDVKTLLKLGMEVGSHSTNHFKMDNLDKDVARKELVMSQRVIENKTGAPCQHFAYPGGFHSEMTTNLLAETGYVSAVTTLLPGFNAVGCDLRLLKRFSMPKVTPKLPYLVSGMEKNIRQLIKFAK